MHRLLLRLTTLDPNYDGVYINYGIVLNKLGRFEKMLEITEQGLERFQKTKLIYNKALALAGLKNYSESMYYLNVVLKIDPNFKVAQNLLNLLNEHMQ